ncbi:uncharacterized protein [Haliotis cracherodii]|uniref:uncharacterized protein n=1 Tax=Haliotis cracherodii TaxID=6455 RepID=UPI0039EC9774
MHVDAFKSKLVHRTKIEVTPIPRIYDDEIANLRKNHDIVPDGVLAEIPTFAAMKTILYRQRHKTVPRLHQSRLHVNLEGEWTRTQGGERFLHTVPMSEGEDPILIFTTDKNLELLCEADIVYEDGTFSSSPKLFDQVYTIHAEFQEHMFPLVFCLLPNKAECTYVRAFEYIQEAAHNLGFDWTPRVFQQDFERAAHNAVESVFATTHTRGCFFHFTECKWRRVQKEGLATEYTSVEEVKKVVRRASALPLVPLDMVEDVWADAIADSPQSVKVTRFMDYITTTWVEGSWSKDLWNHFGNQGRRTNNNLEGWHHHLNKSAQTHPNIFEVVNLLKQSLTEVRVEQLGAHPRAPARKRKYRVIDSRLCALKEDLLNQLTTTMDYTDDVADLLHWE